MDDPHQSVPGLRQGWHPDPFGLHESRYFSADGQATKLVRDKGQEAYDEPPSQPSLAESPHSPSQSEPLTPAPEPPAGPELPEAGWYLDPLDPDRGRFWDGQAWSDQTQALDRGAGRSGGEANQLGNLEPTPQIVERACPACATSQTMAVSATTFFCPRCSRTMYFVCCANCQNVAVVNAAPQRRWTCPTCNLEQISEPHVATASGRLR